MSDRHQLLAVMFTDIQGYSSMMAADEATTVRVVREHREIVRSALAEHGGREMRTIGDAFLILFDAPREAVACGIAIQERLLARNRGRPAPEQVRLRIGVHAGDVLVGAEGELYGESVNIAARIEPLAPPGGLCLSEPVHAAVIGLPYPVSALGTVPLKNIGQPPALYAVRVDPDAPEPRRAAVVSGPTNLAPPTRSVVGRRREVDELRASLRAGNGLITILGPGGTGKTTLLGLLGRDELGAWPGGVWFCDLTETTDAAGVCAVVAGALGTVASLDPASIGEALSVRPATLLLLDNAEQNTAGVRDLVAQWLARAPQTAILVTSREKLGLGNERLFPLEALPPADGAQLFLDRARAARPDFRAEGAEADAITTLVRALDGMPLAIEICAARARYEPPSRLLARLSGRLDLRGAATDGPSRQRTLRSTIAWSWALLSDPERLAMAQLSVFAGPFDLEAAEAVVALDGWPEADPLQVIESLIDKSLLRAGPGWYESLRAFAAEKLVDPTTVQREGSPVTGPEAALAARDRHAAWFATWTPSPGGPTLWDRVDNVTAALEHAIARGDGDRAARLWLRLCDASRLHGPRGTTLAWGRRLPPIADDRLRVRMLHNLGRIALDCGDRVFALQVARQEMAAARSPEEEALACLAVGAALVLQAPAEEVDAVLARGLDLAGDGPIRLDLLSVQSLAWATVAPDRFRAINGELIARLQRAGFRGAERVSLHNEALMRMGEGRLEEAAELTSANLREVLAEGDRLQLGASYSSQAHLENLRGAWARAKGYASEGARVCQAIGEMRFTVNNLAALGVAEAGLGEADAARRHAAQAVALARRTSDDMDLCLAIALEAWTLGLLGADEGARSALAEAWTVAGRLRAHPHTHLGAFLRAAGAASASRGR